MRLLAGRFQVSPGTYSGAQRRCRLAHEATRRGRCRSARGDRRRAEGFAAQPARARRRFMWLARTWSLVGRLLTPPRVVCCRWGSARQLERQRGLSWCRARKSARRSQADSDKPGAGRPRSTMRLVVATLALAVLQLTAAVPDDSYHGSVNVGGRLERLGSRQHHAARPLSRGLVQKYAIDRGMAICDPGGRLRRPGVRDASRHERLERLRWCSRFWSLELRRCKCGCWLRALVRGARPRRTRPARARRRGTVGDTRDLSPNLRNVAHST